MNECLDEEKRHERIVSRDNLILKKRILLSRDPEVDLEAFNGISLLAHHTVSRTSHLLRCTSDIVLVKVTSYSISHFAPIETYVGHRTTPLKIARPGSPHYMVGQNPLKRK